MHNYSYTSEGTVKSQEGSVIVVSSLGSTPSRTATANFFAVLKHLKSLVNIV